MRLTMQSYIPLHLLHLGYKFGFKFPSSQGEKGKLSSQQFMASTPFKNKTTKKETKRKIILSQEAKLQRDTREISSGGPSQGRH